MEIQTLSDVRAFFERMVAIVGDEWHPDDDYAVYRDRKTKQPMFLPEEIETNNRLQAECFAVCEALDEDIYDLGWDVIEKSIV